MSLKGSLHTVALPEVLQFLATTAKSGELHIQGLSGEGRLWFEGGSISGFDAGTSRETDEAIFELLRMGEGEFDFDVDAAPSDAAHAVSGESGQVGPALERAEARLSEWNRIVEVVPSLDHVVMLVRDAPSDSILVDRSQWGLIVAVGAGRPVREVIAEQDLSEYEGCRAIRDLVESSLARIVDPPEETWRPEGGPEESGHPEEGPEEAYEATASALEESPVGPADEPPFPEPPFAEPAFDAAGPVLETFRLGDFGSDDDHDHDHDEAAAAAAEDTFLTASAEDDRYAALRAAVVDIGDGITDPPGEWDGDTIPAEDDAAAGRAPAGNGTGGRAALQALLEEVASQTLPPEDEAEADDVDGLADRGPWTSGELSALETMQGWRDDEEYDDSADPVDVEADDDAGDADSASVTDVEFEPMAEEAAEETPVEEPINRGLLLKFLSSVRN